MQVTLTCNISYEIILCLIKNEKNYYYCYYGNFE